ncbi:MAG: molybdopterin-dependent oxidoreductase [Nocardioides sp.]
MKFEINGTHHEIDPDAPPVAGLSAAEFLRERLGLTGTKIACGAGVCGACTVWLDGDPVVSCLLPAELAADRDVTTIEGVKGPGPGLHAVQRAFVAEDALQCGYCTPGFVMEAVAFVDRWRTRHGTGEPSREEIEEALSGHLCRCGAYPAIIAAVQAACRGAHDAVSEAAEAADGAGSEATDEALPEADAMPAGPRVEAVAKVTGRAAYTVDVRHPGQLYGVLLRSEHPHARVLDLDLRPALGEPGVEAVISLLPEDHTLRYVGHEIAAVAAVDRRTAERALEKIVVAYEKLPAVLATADARSEGSPRVWTGWRKKAPNSGEGPLFPTPWHGNLRGPTASFSTGRRRARRTLDQARAERDPLLVEGRWSTAAQQHTALEPHACVARWLDGSGESDGPQLEVHASTQAAGHLAGAIAKRFRIPVERVRVLAEHVGGGFGAKLGLTAETVAAIELARVTRAPVGIELNREEELSFTGYRPGAEVELALLPEQDGALSALRLSAYADSGIGVGSVIAGLARLIYPGAAKELVDWDVTTHLPPGKPFRGPGGPITCWALEQAVDEAAARLGQDPLALRLAWDPDPLRQRLYHWAAALPGWRDRHPSGTASGRFRRGVGVAAANWFYWYQSGCSVTVEVRDGRVVVSCGTQDMGTGSRSVLANVVAAELGLDPRQIEVRVGDTAVGPGPVSGGSRTTATVVPAALLATAGVKERLAARLDTTASATGLADGTAWAEVIASADPVRVTSDRVPDAESDDEYDAAPRPLAGTGPVGMVFGQVLRRVNHLITGGGYTGAVHVTEVVVDTRLGRTRVEKVYGGLAVGRLHAPELARAQAAGSIVQGIGYALYEQRHHHAAGGPADGVVLTANLEDYRIPGIGDTPEIELHFDEEGFDHVAGGGVGLGEIATLGVAASVGNAIHNATGWRPRDLPVRPDRLLSGLKEAKETGR